jgi:drug/metabolite transporter (DMT)-like permease
MNRARADLLLLFIAFIWGTAFVAQKEGNAHIGPILFVAVRFAAAAAFLAPWALWEVRRSGAGRSPALSRSDWSGAGWIGLCLCVGCWLQQIGLQTTTATNAGFMTAVYLVIVPFVAWGFSGQPPRALVLLACVVALLGAWLMGAGPEPGQWSRGDLIILGADLVWAVHITLVGHCRGMSARPMLLSFVQCAITALLSLPVALLWQPAGLDALRAALPAIAYAGIVSSGFAFTLQIVAQRHTPAAEAALIMSLESVFAAIAGALLLHESLSLRASMGACLILLGVVLMEIGPALIGTMASLRARLVSMALRHRP